MGWGKWFNDSTGPGEVKEKTERHADGTTDKHYLRTADHVRSTDKENHTHVFVRERPDGSKSAHGFPQKNERKD
jgi:hypothetical protein